MIKFVFRRVANTLKKKNFFCYLRTKSTGLRFDSSALTSRTKIILSTKENVPVKKQLKLVQDFSFACQLFLSEYFLDPVAHSVASRT